MDQYRYYMKFNVFYIHGYCFFVILNVWKKQTNRDAQCPGPYFDYFPRTTPMLYTYLYSLCYEFEYVSLSKACISGYGNNREWKWLWLNFAYIIINLLFVLTNI